MKYGVISPGAVVNEIFKTVYLCFQVFNIRVCRYFFMLAMSYWCVLTNTRWTNVVCFRILASNLLWTTDYQDNHDNHVYMSCLHHQYNVSHLWRQQSSTHCYINSALKSIFFILRNNDLFQSNFEYKVWIRNVYMTWHIYHYSNT